MCWGKSRLQGICWSWLAVCGARYKTRQGLSYHLSHTHKGGRTNSGSGRSRGGGNNPSTPRADAAAAAASAGASYQPQAYQSDALAGLAEFQDSYLGYLSAGQDASPTGMPLIPPSSRPCLCLPPLLLLLAVVCLLACYSSRGRFICIVQSHWFIALWAPIISINKMVCQLRTLWE